MQLFRSLKKGPDFFWKFLLNLLNFNLTFVIYKYKFFEKHNNLQQLVKLVYTGGSGKSQVEIRCETLPLAFRQTSQLEWRSGHIGSSPVLYRLLKYIWESGNVGELYSTVNAALRLSRFESYLSHSNWNCSRDGQYARLKLWRFPIVTERFH